MAPWVTGVKTGHTFGAGYVLVGSGQRKGVELISVVIGAPTDEDRFSDNLDLLDYGFSQYRKRVPIRAGADLAAAVDPLRGRRAAAARRAQRRRRHPPRPAAWRSRCGRRARSRDRSAAAPRWARRPSSSTACARRSVPLRAGRAVPEASTLRPGAQLRRRQIWRWLVVILAACRRDTDRGSCVLSCRRRIADDPHRHPQRRDRPHGRGAELPPRPPPPGGREPHRRRRQGDQRRPRAEACSAAR